MQHEDEELPRADVTGAFQTAFQAGAFQVAPKFVENPTPVFLPAKRSNLVTMLTDFGPKSA